MDARRREHSTVSSVRQLPGGRYNAGQRLTIIVFKNLRCARSCDTVVHCVSVYTCYRDALDARRVPGKYRNIYTRTFVRTQIHTYCKYIYARARTHRHMRYAQQLIKKSPLSVSFRFFLRRGTIVVLHVSRWVNTRSHDVLELTLNTTLLLLKSVGINRYCVIRYYNNIRICDTCQ